MVSDLACPREEGIYSNEGSKAVSSVVSGGKRCNDSVVIEMLGNISR
jgi:hypothetical protein